MLKFEDREKLIEASHGAKDLVRDLRDLVTCEEPLLADLALEILQAAVQIEQRLNRIQSITKAAFTEDRITFTGWMSAE